MNAKHWLLSLSALLVAAGVWLTWSTWRAEASRNASGGVDNQTLESPIPTGQRLRPPNPVQRFVDFTPEQRVEFAKGGQGPGG